MALPGIPDDDLDPQVLAVKRTVKMEVAAFIASSLVIREALHRLIRAGYKVNCHAFTVLVWEPPSGPVGTGMTTPDAVGPIVPSSSDDAFLHDIGIVP